MNTTMMARIFLDTIGLLEAEVDTPQKAEEFKAIVFESAEGELALASLERALGLALVPTGMVTQLSCGQLHPSVDIRMWRTVEVG